jgi:hypothetical protein
VEGGRGRGGKRKGGQEEEDKRETMGRRGREWGE